MIRIEDYDQMIGIIDSQAECGIITEEAYNRMKTKIFSKYKVVVESYIEDQEAKIEKLYNDGAIGPKEYEKQKKMLVARKSNYKENVKREEDMKSVEMAKQAKEDAKMTKKIERLVAASISNIRKKVSSFKKQNQNASEQEISKQLSSAYAAEKGRINAISDKNLKNRVMDELKKSLFEVKPKMITEAADEKAEEETDDSVIAKVVDYLDGSNEEEVFKSVGIALNKFKKDGMLTGEGLKVLEKGISDKTEITKEMFTPEGLTEVEKQGELFPDLKKPEKE